MSNLQQTPSNKDSILFNMQSDFIRWLNSDPTRRFRHYPNIHEIEVALRKLSTTIQSVDLTDVFAN